MILFADSEDPDQTVQMRRLIWAFAVCICPKTGFRMAQLYFSTLDKLLFGVFTQLKFLKKLFRLNLWGKYANISISWTHEQNRVAKRKFQFSNTQFNEKWVGKNSPKYQIA